MTSARTLLQSLAGDAEIEALLSDAADLEAMLRFEAELASAEAACGLISDAAAEAVRLACEGFAPDWPALAAGIARDGVVVPAFLAQLRAGMPPADRAALHFGATSQDAIDTSLVLRLAKILPLLRRRLESLIGGFDRLAAAQGGQPVMAHTRMQQALPTTWGQRIAAWSGPLTRVATGLAELEPRLLVVQLGGPVGDRQSFGGQGDAIAEELAGRLGLGNVRPWHNQRDRIAELGASLGRLTGALGKFGADVLLATQNEVGTLVVSGGGGSSSMPHKSNPVEAEVLVALARHGAGLVGSLQQAMVHENERSGTAWTLEWLTLPPLLVAAGASLRIALELQPRIEIPNPPVAAAGSTG